MRDGRRRSLWVASLSVSTWTLSLGLIATSALSAAATSATTRGQWSLVPSPYGGGISLSAPVVGAASA
jgi:hypothetical protein